MKVIICYDVTEDKLRYRLVKYLEKVALRVQYSVFAADLAQEEIQSVRRKALKLIAPDPEASLMVFHIHDTFDGMLDMLPTKFIYV